MPRRSRAGGRLIREAEQEAERIPRRSRRSSGLAAKNCDASAIQRPIERMRVEGRLARRRGSAHAEHAPHGGEIRSTRFEVDGKHFSSTVHADTLQVIDAASASQGSDRELTLDSLPSVIREAVRDDILHITRH